MNETIRKLLPHMYFVLGFVFAFLAVPQAIPFSDQYGSYAAIIVWVFGFGFGEWYIIRKSMKANLSSFLDLQKKK